MKVYVVTSLIESQDEGAEVNVVGTTDTLEKARNLVKEVLDEAKEMYEENNFDYDIEEISEDCIVIRVDDDYERIEYNVFESEV